MEKQNLLKSIAINDGNFIIDDIIKLDEYNYDQFINDFNILKINGNDIKKYEYEYFNEIIITKREYYYSSVQISIQIFKSGIKIILNHDVINDYFLKNFILKKLSLFNIIDFFENKKLCIGLSHHQFNHLLINDTVYNKFIFFKL
jgi:hypothetical protein